MNYDLVLTCMAAFLKMEADNVPLTAGEAKVGTGETDLGTGIDLTDFLLVAQIGVEEGIHFQEPAMSATNQGIVPQNVQKSGAQFYGSGALTSTITHSN
jgi:hypothetical protein